MLHGQHFIDGHWRTDGECFQTRSPSNLDDLAGEYPQGRAQVAAEALAAARKAFPPWAAFNPQGRSDLLRKAGDAIVERANTIGTQLAREEGKVRRDALAETLRAAQIFHYYSGEALRHPGQHYPSVRDGHSVLVSYEPVGVIALITPWNFPIALPAWKVAAALAYGNTCVLKPSEFAPGCAVLLGHILEEVGFPPGVFNLVHGEGRLLGETLVRDANAVSFTGSTATGRIIARQASQTLTKVQLELGGKNPLVVLDDADLDQAVELAAQAVFGQTGQRCTGAERLIVTQRIHDAFVERAVRKAAALRVGDAMLETSEIGPVATASQLERNLTYIELAKQEGAHLAVGGSRIDCRTPGHYLAPTLFVDTRNDMRVNREEIFGPIAGVIKVADLDEAIAVANDCELALSSGICTRSLQAAERFRRASRAGVVTINAPTAGIDYHVPFGGRAPSGYGARELGAACAEFFTESKTTYINHGVT